MLECSSLRMTNTWASWSRAPAAVLALYPLGYAREYGRSYDSPYLQSSSICGVSHGDMLNRLGTLDFRLLAEDGSEFTGAVEPFTFSMVFWTLEPERPIEPYEFYHILVSSESRRSGIRGDFEIDMLLPDLAMSEEPAAWHAAISWMSDPGVSAAIVIPQLMSVFSATPVIGYTDGPRRSLKPLTRDTIGLAAETPLDRSGYLRVRLLDPVSLGALGSVSIDPWVFALTIYKYK